MWLNPWILNQVQDDGCGGQDDAVGFLHSIVSIDTIDSIVSSSLFSIPMIPIVPIVPSSQVPSPSSIFSPDALILNFLWSPDGFCFEYFALDLQV